MEKKETFSWRTLSHEHTHKDPDWFWGIGIVATSIAVIAILIGNPLFGILIAIGAVTLFLHAIKKPEFIDIEISEEGIDVGGSFFSRENLLSFSVVSEDGRPIVILKSKHILTPRLVLPIKRDGEKEVRDALLKYLPEEKLEIPISHKFLEFLGL